MNRQRLSFGVEPAESRREDRACQGEIRVVFLGETVTAEVASGLALAIIGVALINTRTRRGIG